jgi:signal transduction histidine kinase
MRRIKKGKILDNDFLFERFNIILEETERTDELYKKISDTTTQNISIQSFKIADAIKKRISILGNILEEKNISINIEGELEVKINWDLIKFEQILINLINNSIYAIQKKNPKKGMIIFILKDLGSNVLIEYSDNGIGIPFEIREKIFTPFFTTKPQTEGEWVRYVYCIKYFQVTWGGNYIG